MTDWTKKGPGDVFKEGNKAAEVMKKLTPRAVPMKFGYMRVDPANPNAATYRQMLQAQNLDRFFEDVPAGIGVRPQFEAMIAELRPKDTVFMIRLNHLTTQTSLALGLLRSIAEEKVHIVLISNAAQDATPTAALTLDILAHVERLGREQVIEGNDGGSGNGGP